MSTPWPVPGYALVEPLASQDDRPDGGDAWLARRSGDGAAVVVRFIAGVDDDGLRRLRSDAAVLGSLAHPHLVAVLDVIRTDGHGAAVVTDAVPGPRLVDLLARTGGLDGGAVVTLLAPLADAVAALHGRGLTHGDIRAETVLLTPGGRPLLDVPAVRNPLAHPYDDVRGLARLGLRALADADRAPAAVVQAMRGADIDEPGRRPTAAAFAADLLRACPATPLPTTAAPGPPPMPHLAPEPATTQRRGVTGVALRVAIGVAGLALAVVAGTAWGNVDSAANAGHPTAPAASLPPLRPAATAGRTAARPQPDWRAVAAGLERRRAAAIRAGDVAALRRIYLPGCAAGRRDVRLLRDLDARGLRVRGLHPSVATVTVVRAGPRPVLRVTDDLSVIRVVDADNRVVRRRPRRRATAVRLTLARRGSGWAIARVGQPTSARKAASTSS